MLIKTHAKLRHKIRHCNRIIKNARNESKAYRAETYYYQTVIDKIKEEQPWTQQEEVLLQLN